jgi:hypothetical protein
MILPFNHLAQSASVVLPTIVLPSEKTREKQPYELLIAQVKNGDSS